MLSRRELIGSLSVASALGAAERDSPWTTIADVSALVRTKKVSPVELTQMCLGRIRTLNDRLNAFITITAEPALQQAKMLEAEARAGKWRGPLHGIPIALKDLFDTEGVRTTAASKHWSERVPSSDADVVGQASEAGGYRSHRQDQHG
jgi:aspartyl-tRNA(Asn)/glutamyl-tRNA(Gln) amidotransferase subunit A